MIDASLVLDLVSQFAYPILIILTILEGPFVMIFSGFLIKSGVLPLVPVFLVVSIGDLLGDALWYGAGYYSGHKFIIRFGRFFDITQDNVERAIGLFHLHRKKIIIGSKLTNGAGFSLAVLMAAGIARVPFLEYMILNGIAQIPWTIFMLGLGYLFGNIYGLYDDIVGRIFIVVMGIVTVFFLLRFVRYIGRKMQKNST